jgi:hypothetical protein
MKDKTSFRNSSLLVLAAACLAMTAFGCFKTDSLGLAADSDGGADAGSEGNACGAGVPVHYSAAGCGSHALPICGAFNVDACTAVISYCGCDGQTTIYGACGTSPSPFLYVGACQPGSDVGLSPNPVAWHTPTVSLTADDFWIMADGQRYTSASAFVSVHSDPGWATYTTLELVWTENGREMRMFIYFYANSTSWWSDEIRTYNGQTGYGDWLYYYGTFFASPIGSAYRGNIDITNIATDQFRGELHMHGLVLSTTLSGTTPPTNDGGADATDATPSCTVQVFKGNVSDCSGTLPLPCSPCIACYPLAPGDNGGCAAPDLSMFDWKGGGVDMSLRYPVGCSVYLPTQNPYYPGGAQSCTCTSIVGMQASWICPI